MKKSLLLLSLTALVASGLEARTLSPAEALQRALGSSSASVSRSGQPAVQSTPVMTVGEAQAPAAYVFAQDREGFLIISADDVAAPLLGYSESGTFDPDNIPDNLRWWLSEYAAQIQAANAAGASVYDGGMQSVRTPIAPLLKTTWDQGAPYNDDCPVYRNQRTVTGCVATAMAQVMNYHKWPDIATTNANFSYEWQTGKYLNANYSGKKFEWNSMLDSYAGSYTDAQVAAVSDLMKACGYSVEMNYDISSNGGSGAVSEKVGGALVKAFKYSPDLENAPRILYTTAQWNDLIYNELADKRPVLYAGTGSAGGHCFVCDGYNGKGYFHFNWGWSGVSDGYFLLNALDPENLGIGGGSGGFNLNQMALIGVKPTTTPSTKLPVKFVAEGLLTASISGDKLVIGTNFMNYSTGAVSGTMNFEFRKTDGKAIQTFKMNVSNFEPGTYYPALSLSVSQVASVLPQGTSRLYITFTVNGDKTYPFLCSPDQPGYIELVKSGSTLSVGSSAASAYSVEISGLETGFFVNTEFYVKGNAITTGKSESVMQIYGVLMTQPSADAIVGVGDGISQTFDPAAPQPFDYLSGWFLNPSNTQYVANISPGRYYFAMAVESGTGYMLLSEPVDVIVKAQTTTIISGEKFSIADADGVNPDKIDVSVDVNCLSGVFNDPIMFALFSDMDGQIGGNIDQFITESVVIGEGNGKTVNYSFSLPDASEGEAYFLAPNYWNYSRRGWTQLTDAVRFVIGKRSGISDVIADGAGKITASPNPAEDYTVISASADIVRVDLVSVGGLMTGVPVEIDGTTARLDVSRLSSGLYVARVVTATGVEAVKIVKK